MLDQLNIPVQYISLTTDSFAASNQHNWFRRRDSWYSNQAAKYFYQLATDTKSMNTLLAKPWLLLTYCRDVTNSPASVQLIQHSRFSSDNQLSSAIS